MFPTKASVDLGRAAMLLAPQRIIVTQATSPYIYLRRRWWQLTFRAEELFDTILTASQTV